MAGIDTDSADIILDRAGDFILPFFLRSSDGNHIDVSNDMIVLSVEGGFSLSATPSSTDPSLMVFHFTKAMAANPGFS